MHFLNFSSLIIVTTFVAKIAFGGTALLIQSTTSTKNSGFFDYILPIIHRETDLTANQYAEGYLFVNDVNGEGQCLKVKSNPAHDHSDDPSVIITCYDDLATALTTSSQLTLMPNPYSAVVVAPATHTGACVGATTIDMTASYYGWFQTHGPAALLTDGTLTLVSPAGRSDGTAGAVEVLDSDADAEGQVIGQVMCVSADSEYSLIWMNL